MSEFIWGLPTALAATGAVIDLLLLRRQKIAVYRALFRTWFRIDERRFPEIARQLGALIATRFAISGLRSWLRFICLFLPLSVLTTYLAATLGRYLDNSVTPSAQHGFGVVPIYGIAALSSLVGLFVTYRTALLVSRSRPMSIVLIALVSTLANTALVVLLIPLTVWAGNRAIVYDWPGSGGAIYALPVGIVGEVRTMERLLEKEIVQHLTEKPGTPFLFEAKKWNGTDPDTGDKITSESISIRIDFGPSDNADTYRQRLKRMRSETLAIGADRTEFTSSEDFISDYVRSLRSLVSSFKTWRPSLRGSIQMRGATWSSHIDSMDVAFLGRWSVIAISLSVAMPTVMAGLLMAFLACLQLIRTLVSKVTQHLLERVTENDPENDSGAFLPLTILSSGLAIFLSAWRLLVDCLVHLTT